MYFKPIISTNAFVLTLSDILQIHKMYWNIIYMKVTLKTIQTDNSTETVNDILQSNFTWKK